jgi:hypothetical protein
MSSNLYIKTKPKDNPENSFYELKFLMRRLLDCSYVDHEIDDSYIETFRAAMVTTEDPDVRESLKGLIERLEDGEILIMEEKC